MDVLAAVAVIDRVITVRLVDDKPPERPCLGVADEKVALVTVDTKNKSVSTVGLQWTVSRASREKETWNFLTTAQ